MHYASRPVYRAHPRSRGENTARTGRRRAVRGSSPLTRGKSVQHLHSRAGHGLIPAHAGKIVNNRKQLICHWAHPRSRGENRTQGGGGLVLPGSSPLTRGKSPSGRRQDRPSGLIPAHAGKIGRGTHGRGQRGAHPRSRGENLQRENCSRADQGSSPLTRGKYGGELGVGRGGGLIPAHAGKIRNGASPASHAWAHPRSRGENAELGFTKVGGSGSSPLTRGKSPTTNVLAIERGSSPLTRGKFVLVDQVPQILGLIPAHAGKICSAGTTLVWNQAHPRSRGENMSASVAACCASGSSPLTRGK